MFLFCSIESEGETMTAFGRWLVGQKDRKDSWIGGLASQAAKDRGFPIEGDVETVVDEEGDAVLACQRWIGRASAPCP